MRAPFADMCGGIYCNTSHGACQQNICVCNEGLAVFSHSIPTSRGCTGWSDASCQTLATVSIVPFAANQLPLSPGQTIDIEWTSTGNVVNTHVSIILFDSPAANGLPVRLKLNCKTSLVVF